jgi:hypothetical protein
MPQAWKKNIFSGAAAAGFWHLGCRMSCFWEFFGERFRESVGRGLFFLEALGFELTVSHLLGYLPLRPLYQPAIFLCVGFFSR